MSSSNNNPEWKILFLLLPLVLLELYVVAPALAPGQCRAHPDLFLEFASRYCHPEPLKSIRYLLIVGSVPVVCFVWLKWRVNELLTQQSERLSVLLELTAQTAAIAFVGITVCSTNLFFDPVSQDKYWYAAAIVLIALSVGYCARRKLAALPARLVGVAACLVAAALTLTNLTTDVFSWEALTHAAGSVSSHLPFTLGEFSAALSGKTMFVDFFPMYQNFSEYILQPVFLLTGLNPTTFTVCMALVSAAGFLLMYSIFWRVTGDVRLAALLFLPYVILSFFCFSPIVERANNFNYFANGPLRFFGVWAVAFCITWYFHKPASWKRRVCLFVAAFAALNNLDFGLAAFLSSVVVLALVDADGNFASIKHSFAVAYEAAIAVCSALTLVVGITFFRSGSFPQLQKLIEYQRTFAVEGYFAVPIPEGLFYWLPLVTWSIAIFMGLRKLLQHENEKNVVLIALLLFSGLAGCGTGMYFIGRSRWENLVALFPGWCFSLMIIAWAYIPPTLSKWKTGGLSFRLQSTIPLVLSLLGYAFCWSRVIDTPDPSLQVKRVLSPATSKELPFAMLSELKAISQPGEAVIIVYPYADWLARQAAVQNVFPFTGRNQMVLRSQLDLAMTILHKKQVRKVYGCLPIEMRNALTRGGFVRIGQLNGGAVDRQAAFDTLSSPFEYWLRRGSLE